MSLHLSNTPVTADDYLAWEATQDTRNEFIDGQFHAMSGCALAPSTLAHNAATLATGATLRQHLKGTPCRAYVFDVRVQTGNSFLYPDLVVACQSAELAAPPSLPITEPKLIVEVLSPSTAAFDMGGKFVHYRGLNSLQEYVLIDPDTAQVDVFRRNAANRWELFPSMGGSATVELASVGWQGTVADLLE